MIRVAAGEKLPFTQADIPRRGWAIECRINAEDPFRSFLPSTGRLVRYQPPPQTMEAAAPVPEGGGVRVDTGVYEGGEIPMYYDSMIAKLIVHGLDRDDAIAKMREALNGFVIRGVSSNIPFQAALLAHPKFVAGDFNTGFIAEHYAHGFRAEDVPHDDPRLPGGAGRRGLPPLPASAPRASAASWPGTTCSIGNEFVVVRQGPAGRARARAGEHQVERRRRVVSVATGAPMRSTATGSFGGIRASGSCNGEPFTAQVERHGLWLPRRRTTACASRRRC